MMLRKEIQTRRTGFQNFKNLLLSRHQQIQEIRFYLLSQKAENIFLKKQVSAVRKRKSTACGAAAFRKF